MLCRSRLRAANRRKPSSASLTGQVGRYQSVGKVRVSSSHSAAIHSAVAPSKVLGLLERPATSR